MLFVNCSLSKAFQQDKLALYMHASRGQLWFVDVENDDKTQH